MAIIKDALRSGSMNLYRIIVATLIGLNYSSVYAQGEFSLGIRSAIGFTPFSNHSKLLSAGTTSDVRNQMSVSHGVAIRYLVGGLFGLETGAHINSYAFSSKNEVYSISHFLGLEGTAYLLNLQVPLLFVLKKDHPTNPYKHFKFIAGTTVDWNSSYATPSEWGSLPWLKNLVIGMRVGSAKQRVGKFEYGLEYQYSRSFTFNMIDFRGQEKQVTTRLHLLAVTLHYFFYPIKHTNGLSNVDY